MGRSFHERGRQEVEGSLWMWTCLFLYYALLFLWWLRGFIRVSKKLECSLKARLNGEPETEGLEKSSFPEH